MVDIIIKKISPKGRTRSKIEKDLMKEWGSAGLDEEQIDKCDFLEKVAKEQLGSDKSFFTQRKVDSMDKVE